MKIQIKYFNIQNKILSIREIGSFFLAIIGVFSISPLSLSNVFVPSILNYLLTIIAISCLIFDKFFLNKISMQLMYLMIINALFSEYFNLKYDLILLSHIIIFIVSMNSFRNKNFFNLVVRIMVISSIIISMMSLILMYALALQNYPIISTHSFNQFIADASVYGVTKISLNFFLGVSIIYFFVSRRYILMALYIIYSLPALLSMRMGIFAFFILTIWMFFSLKFERNFTNLLIFFTVSIVIFLLVQFNSFDRAVNYQIALNILQKYPFGLGFNQYINYIDLNYPNLFYSYSIVFNDGMEEIWNTTEAMFCNLIATFGVLGLVIILSLLHISNFFVTNFKFFDFYEKIVSLFFVYSIINGIARDFSNLNLFYYYFVGMAVSIKLNFKKLDRL